MFNDHVRVNLLRHKQTFYPPPPCASCERLNSLLHDIMGRVLDGSNMVTHTMNGTSFVLGMVTLGYVLYALIGIEYEFGFIRDWLGGPRLCWGVEK